MAYQPNLHYIHAYTHAKLHKHAFYEHTYAHKLTLYVFFTFKAHVTLHTRTQVKLHKYTYTHSYAHKLTLIYFFCHSGSRVSAERAAQLGLISKACADEDLDRTTQSYVDELLTSGPLAMQKIKTMVDFISDHTHEANIKMVSTRCLT